MPELSDLARNVYWLGSLPVENFSEEELRKTYRKAVELGIDIIEVRSYTTVRDEGGAPDIEYAYFKPSEVLPVYEGLEEDFLKLQVDIAHKEGLLTRTYLNAHWYGTGFYKRHRDWAQVKADGRPVDNLYGHGYSMCVNTGYRDRMIKLILEVAKRGVDIIFLDGPAYYPGACYCKACREKFYDLYGEDIPVKENWDNPLWRRFVKFRYKSLREFLVDVQKALEKEGLKTLVYSNTSGQTWPVWHFALNMEELWEGESILAAESYQYYRSTIGVPSWLYGWTTKYGYSVKRGKPFCLFLSRAHAPWVYYRIPEVERSLASFQGIANGANILEYCPEVKPLIKVVKKWSRFFEYLEPIAEVAVVWSRNSADFSYDKPSQIVGETSFEAQAVQVETRKPVSSIKEESLKRFVEEARGFYEMLLRLHVPFHLIGDVNLVSSDIRKYKTIILPSTVSISRETARRLKDYVEEGGNIIASFKIGLVNEYGDPYEDSILSDLLKFKFTGKIYGPLPWDYMKISKEHPVFKNIPVYSRREKLLPSPNYSLMVEAKEEYVIAEQLEHLYSRYQPPENLKSVTPAIVASEHGLGKVLYFTGNFGGRFWEHGFIDYLKILENALNWMNNKKIVSLKAPETVEISISKGENHYLIFLINHTYPRRPFNNTLPAYNVEITLNTYFTPSKAIDLILGKELKYNTQEGKIKIFLPVLNEYSIILLQ